MYAGYIHGEWYQHSAFIPADTPDEKIAQVALDTLRADFEETGQTDVVFIGVYPAREGISHRAAQTAVE